MYRSGSTSSRILIFLQRQPKSSWLTTSVTMAAGTHGASKRMQFRWERESLPLRTLSTPSLPTGLIVGPPLSRKHARGSGGKLDYRSEEHTSELQSHSDLVCRLLLEKKKTQRYIDELY